MTVVECNLSIGRILFNSNKSPAAKVLTRMTHPNYFASISYHWRVCVLRLSF